MLTYTNTYGNKQMSYDPETEGYWAVRFKNGMDGKMADGRSLSLGFGTIGTPHFGVHAAIADLALTIARFPEMKGRLGVYKIPCVYSTNDGHVFITDIVGEELAAEADGVAKSFGFSSRDSYESKHKMSRVYC
jgi:hypothetical protein